MAATSILATICAERLTKFLTRYSRVQTGNLRCCHQVKAVKSQLPLTPPARTLPVERKFSLWQSSEQQYQMSLLERTRDFEHVFTQDREAGSVQGSMMSSASRRSIADCMGQPLLGQSVALRKARCQALANYANRLLNSKSKSKSQMHSNF